MGKIRVIRIMEYVYVDAEVMVDDMERWAVKQVVRPNPRMTIKSVTLTPELIKEAYDNPLILEED